MRIDCDQCSAAFTIDDAVISDRGVRAQCPKCGHQKVVKKPTTAATPRSPTPQNPFGGLAAKPAGNPFGAPAGSSNPFGPPAGAGNPFGAPPAPAPGANPFAAPTAPAANPFGGGESLGAPPAAAGNPFGAPSPAPVANPFGAPPSPAPGANPFGASPFGAPSPAPSANPFGAPSAPSPAPSANPFGAPSAPSPAPSGNNPFGAPPAPGAPPLGGPPAAPAPAANPFGGAPAAPSAPVNPFGAPSASVDPFQNRGAAPSANPFGAPPSPGPAISVTPFGAPPPAPSANPFGAPPPPAPAANPFGSPSSTGPTTAAFGAGNPFQGGSGAPKSDVDPFANVSTSNDPGPRAGGGFESPPSTGPGPGQWVLRTAVGEEYLDVAELRERLKAGSVRPDDLCGPPGETPKPAREQPALNVSVTTNVDRPRVAGARAAGAGFSVPKPLIAAVLGLAVVGGGVAVYTLKPELFERQSEAGVNPLRRARSLWQRQFPDIEGTAQEHLVEGRKQMRLDTAAGYRKADDELRQSLLLDVSNLGAIAAWAENFANLPTVRADLESSNLAIEAIDYGLKRDPQNVDLLRAQGALTLALGKVDEAQRILTKAKTLAPGDVDTLVWLARANLDRTPETTLSIIQREVRAKVPDLKVAYTIEGAAHRRLGAFKKAREMLDARLVSDSANVGALKELAKLELDLGQADAALAALTKLIDAEDKDVEAHLLRAKITYQIRGGIEGLKLADAQLTEVLAKHEGAAGELLLSVLAHASFVKAQLGALDEAVALGERARATDPAFTAGLYALGHAYAKKGDLDAAKGAYDQAVRSATTVATEFFEPLIRAELATVQARAGDMQNAIRNNEKVLDIDSRNLRAYFSLGAIFMKEGKFSQANTNMAKALAVDPNWENDRRVPTDFPTPADELLAFADAFHDAEIDPRKEPDLRSLQLSAEGVIRFHAGQMTKATALFTDALKIDRNNRAALLYQGIIDLQEGRATLARKRLQTAIDTKAAADPITKLYLARSLFASGEVEAARKQLEDLIETEPTLVQARYSLALTLREQGLEAQAQDQLRMVVRQDRDFLPAKQALARN